MCGHIRRHTDGPSLTILLNTIGMGDLILQDGDFYPGSRVDGVILNNEQGIQSIQGLWWFLLDESTGKPNYKYVTFNTRNLQSRLWKQAVQYHRCLIPLTGIGESIGEGRNKRSFLMEGEAFFLGGLYRTYKINEQLIYTFSIITRDPQPGFSQYHDKAIPLFLPPDNGLLNQWLDPHITNIDLFREVLNKPKIPVDLTVTPVTSTKKLEPIGKPELLLKDI